MFKAERKSAFRSDPITPSHEAAFGALCTELGICLHAKGQAKVAAALPNGLDAAVKAVFEAEGIDFLSAPGELKRQVRDCLKANPPT